MRLPPARQQAAATRRGFTLVELLVSCAILALITVLLSKMVGLTVSAWTKTQSKAEQFQQAREAFDAVTRRLSEATLNTYSDYVDANGDARTSANSNTFVPARYVRQSELRFLCGPGISVGDPPDPAFATHQVFFQAPEGRQTDGGELKDLLNTIGFFVKLGDDTAFLPSVLAADADSHTRQRFRLLQMIEPSEKLSVYKYTAGQSDYNGKEWFQDALTDGSGISIVSENVIALVLLPMLTEQDQGTTYNDASLAPAYLYDSTVASATAALNAKNQLPPVVKVTLVALDEASSNRMTDADREALKTHLDGLFQAVGSTLDATLPGYAHDLQDLEDYLIAKRLNYRIFSSNVSLKAAKWSREQQN